MSSPTSHFNRKGIKFRNQAVLVKRCWFYWVSSRLRSFSIYLPQIPCHLDSMNIMIPEQSRLSTIWFLSTETCHDAKIDVQRELRMMSSQKLSGEICECLSTATAGSVIESYIPASVCVCLCLTCRPSVALSLVYSNTPSLSHTHKLGEKRPC